MRLVDEILIPAPPDRAYTWLLDLQQVAPCVPGGEIGAPDADGIYPGKVSVKLGPMRFVYEGRVRIAERDAAARTALIEGEGKAGGAESAKVRALMEVVPDGEGSRVRMTTDLEIRGRAAQMGAGMIGTVSRQLTAQAAACIAARIAAGGDAGDGALPVAGEVSGIGLMASVASAKVGDAMRRLGRKGEEEKG